MAPTDPEAREKMANAATMAGMAFANAFLGVCHSMAHKLGAFHHLPHGVANALMIERGAALQRRRGSRQDGHLPAVRSSPHAGALCRGGRLPGAGRQHRRRKAGKPDRGRQRRSRRRVGIKATIRDYGVDEKDFLDRLDDMTEQAFDDQCTGANPRYPLMSEIKQMYLNAYYGDH